MKRPNRKDYLRNLDYKESMFSTYTDYYSYTNDLEKYCDELEKAFDKACEELSAMVTCEQDKSTGEIVRMRMLNKEQWKGMLLKDAKTN